MEIVHNQKKERVVNPAFSLTYGERKADQVLQKIEKNLLDQMGSVFSIVHGGEYRKRRNHLSA
jgi:hypothetical protein